MEHLTFDFCKHASVPRFYGDSMHWILSFYTKAFLIFQKKIYCYLIKYSNFSWLASDWSDCLPPCGMGIRKRTVYCVQQTNNQTINVPDKFCMNYTKPVRLEILNYREGQLSFHRKSHYFNENHFYSTKIGIYLMKIRFVPVNNWNFNSKISSHNKIKLFGWRSAFFQLKTYILMTIKTLSLPKSRAPRTFVAIGRQVGGADARLLAVKALKGEV